MPYATTHPPFLLFPTLNLFLITIFFSSCFSNAIPSTAQFREAPEFYNSPDCPTVTIPSDSICAASDSTVHVAMTLDAAYLRGSMAAILSVLQHSSCPQNVVFHFVASSNDRHLRRMIAASFPYLRFQVYHFHESAVSRLISTSIRVALDRPLNYARTYLASLLTLNSIDPSSRRQLQGHFVPRKGHLPEPKLLQVGKPEVEHLGSGWA